MNQGATTLKYIKYCAVTISALMLAGIATLMVLARGTGEDITGIVAPTLLITFLSSVVAIVAAVFQKRVQKAINVKSNHQ
jgi:spore maturation protein SpmA